jgi:aconitate hydratase
MGVLPLEFVDGASVESLGLTGHEVFRITGLDALRADSALPFRVRVHADDRTFDALVRVDTPFERDVFVAGGILPFTLRRLAQ